MQLYHFPSPNPQKVTFALLELGLDCEKIPVDLAKGDHRQPAFLAVNPAGRVPVLVDGDLRLTEFAGDPRLSGAENRPAVAEFGGGAGAGPAMALLPVPAHDAGGG